MDSNVTRNALAEVCLKSLTEFIGMEEGVEEKNGFLGPTSSLK